MKVKLMIHDNTIVVIPKTIDDRHELLKLIEKNDLKMKGTYVDIDLTEYIANEPMTESELAQERGD